MRSLVLSPPRAVPPATSRATRLTAMIRSSASRPDLRGRAARRDRADPHAAGRVLGRPRPARRPASAGWIDVGVGDLCRLRASTAVTVLRLALAQEPDLDATSPTFSMPMVLRSSVLVRIGWPRTDVMTSPASMPARAAAEPSVTCETSAPWAFSASPRLLRNSGVSDSVVHAELAAVHLPGLDQLLHDRADHVRGDREADADVAAGLRQDHRIDADQVAVEPDQRAAGIARIDRGIGLDEVLEAVAADARAAERAHDARRSPCAASPNGLPIAITKSPTCSFEESARRISAGSFASLTLEHRDVRALVGADDFGLELDVVDQRDRDLARVLARRGRW